MGQAAQTSSPTAALSFYATEITQCPSASRTNITRTLYEPLPALTLLRPGVVFAKGVVFGDVGVQKAQWILRNVFSCHHFVVANDVREGNSRELLLGVWFYRVELGLCGWEKQRLLTMVSKFFIKLSRQAAATSMNSEVTWAKGSPGWHLLCCR